MEQPDNTAIARIIAKAWADDGFKARLQASPTETLAAEGIEVPEGVSVAVVENTASLYHLVLPPKPGDADIAEAELEGITGGFCCTAHYSACLTH